MDCCLYSVAKTNYDEMMKKTAESLLYNKIIIIFA